MSLKNLNVASKIPKTLEKNLNHKRIKKIYKNFEKKLLTFLKNLLLQFQEVQIVWLLHFYQKFTQ